MSNPVEDSSQIPNDWWPVDLRFTDLVHLYDLMLGRTDLLGNPGDFLSFYAIWMNSDIFKVPSGYVRVEPYPQHLAATIHGIFLKNPFYDSKNIQSVLQYYLEEHPEYKHLECHVPHRFHGVQRFAKTLSHSSTLHDSKTIYYFGRI